MIDKLFKDIADKLNAGVPELAWIDIEYGQLEIPEDSYPVQFPCALIDFPQIETQDETKGNQQALCTIQIRIGIDLYEDFHIADGNPAIDRDTALARLQILNDVHKCLHGFEGDYFTPMMRIGIQTERRDDGLKVYSITYGCAAKDDTAAKVYEGRDITGFSLL
jgi:hypothetical protein